MTEFYKLYDILSSFLGDAKNGFDGECMQLQFPCPKCIEKYGQREVEKHNLEVNLAIGKYHCWKCSSEDDPMSGSVYGLIRKYGNLSLLKDYKEVIESVRSSEFFKLKYGEDAFSLKDDDVSEGGMRLPKIAIPIESLSKCPRRVSDYLMKRGIDDKIITHYKLLYTPYDANEKVTSNRIIIPSYGTCGELTYWTGRDISQNPKRQRYFNPEAPRKDIIFNEGLIQWDADINLVEGPFDHIVVPNSIPLLGKVLRADYRLFSLLRERSNGHINIFLDGDAKENAIEIYKTLAHGKLIDRVRLVEITERKEDPSSLFKKSGRRGIIEALRKARKLSESELIGGQTVLQ